MLCRTLLAVGAAALLSACSAASQSLDLFAPSSNQSVELVDAGGSPRKSLQYLVRVGDVQKREVVTKIASKMMPDGFADTETVMAVESRIDAIADNGDITHLWRYTSAEARTGADSESGTAIDDQVFDINEWVTSGAQIRVVMSPRGEVREAGFVGDKPLIAALVRAETITYFTPVFPSEPVGVGAKWKTTERMPLAIGELVRTAHYTLKSMAPDEVTLEVRQDFELPAGSVPAVMDWRVLSVKGSGAVTIRQPLTAVLPVESENRSEITSISRWKDDAALDMKQTTTSETRMSAL